MYDFYENFESFAWSDKVSINLDTRQSTLTSLRLFKRTETRANQVQLITISRSIQTLRAIWKQWKLTPLPKQTTHLSSALKSNTNR